MLQSSRRILRRNLYGDASVGQKELPRRSTTDASAASRASHPRQAHDALRLQRRHGVREQSTEEFVRVVRGSNTPMIIMADGDVVCRRRRRQRRRQSADGHHRDRLAGSERQPWSPARRPVAPLSPDPRAGAAPASLNLLQCCRATRYACQLVEVAWLIDRSHMQAAECRGSLPGTGRAGFLPIGWHWPCKTGTSGVPSMEWKLRRPPYMAMPDSWWWCSML